MIQGRDNQLFDFYLYLCIFKIEVKCKYMCGYFKVYIHPCSQVHITFMYTCGSPIIMLMLLPYEFVFQFHNIIISYRHIFVK